MTVNIDITSFVIGMGVMYLVLCTIRRWMDIIPPKVRRAVKSVNDKKKAKEMDEINEPCCDR